MQTILGILAALVSTGIISGVTNAFNLEKRMSALESIKVQVGEESLPKNTSTEAFWETARGGGWRKASVSVVFPQPFKRQPVVMVALKRIDLGDFKSNIHRVGVKAENVTSQGFQLYFETWYESLVFETVVSWIAVSQ
jgi:hypothetical protein